MNYYQSLASRRRSLLAASLGMALLAERVFASDGTLVVLQNPSNSTPRIVSMWGGGGSEQIILKSDGTVWDWGLNGQGQLGNGTTNNSAVPVQVLGPGGIGHLTSVAAIMGGEIHNFALKTDGTVWSWGWNVFGQLGDGSTNWGTVSNFSTTPVQVFGLTSVKSLGCRGYHSLALKNDGSVWAWGDNQYGELGIGTKSSGTNIPVQVVGLTNPASISGGGFFSLALMPDGTVRCWGENVHGECGDGTTTNRYVPVQVIGLTNVTEISGGWFHALALRADGTVWSWGNNSKGELGDGTTTNRLAPVPVAGLSNIVHVSTGDGNSMARGADGTIWKWGDNSYGEMGNGTSDANPHPLAAQVPGLNDVVLSACRDYHNICIQRNGTVRVWGDNRYGGCGDTTGVSVLIPRIMPGLVSGNVIAYEDSFESYPGGFNLVGTNAWSGDTATSAVVTATNYSYNSLLPVPGPHLQSLQINGTVTNQFCPPSCTNVWVDVMLEANPPINPLAAQSNASFALGVTPDGHFAVWNRTNAPATGNGWTVLQDAPAATNQFVRATIKVDYTADANGTFYYSVWLNGLPSTNPASRYAAADNSQLWFSEIVASGKFLLDDLVVGTNKSFYALVSSSTGYGGAISPSGPLIVNPGANSPFTVIASNWYHLGNLTIDGADVGTNAAYTFTNVQADHTIGANYSADLAAQNTPKWWLYQQNANWATNFDLAALGDQDGDGVPTWQEYIAGTSPNDATSVFALTTIQSNGQILVSILTIPTTFEYQSQRYYSLETSTNLLDPSAWQAVLGWTNIPASGQMLLYTNLSATPNRFFRGKVWLSP